MATQVKGALVVVVVVVVLFFFFTLAPLPCLGRKGISKHNLKVQKYLKGLNKPAMKTIKSPDGDIIDCIHVTKQPAFDHPLLQNHTIQMRPTYYPDGRLYDESKILSKPKEKSNSVTQLWHLSGKCPQGTIPVRRTKRKDILRASSMAKYGKKKHRTTPQPKPTSIDPEFTSGSGHQHAIVYVEGDKYYGAKATINVWDPKIQQSNEFSLSQIWILGGTFGEDLNSIEAGWQVSPDLYGDNNTRFFTYWTIGRIYALCAQEKCHPLQHVSDAYQATGCYNLLCSGFIQLNNEIAMGASIYPVSGYGNSQYDISVLVWKDPNEGHWWMQFDDDTVLGYWPSFLFSYLSDSASMIEWGGEVVNSEPDGEHTTTQMGSGHFPGEGFGKTSYFRNIQIVDGSNKFKDPEGVGTFTEQPNCYNVEYKQKGAWGHYFYYGGPGKNPNCP